MSCEELTAAHAPSTQRGTILAHLPIYALIFTQGSVWTAFFALGPDYRRTLELSKLELGTVSAAFGVATLLTALPIGIVTDRIGARTILIVSGAFLTVAALGHALATGFWLLLLARSIYATTIVLIWTAATSWLSQSVAPDRRSTALAAMWPVLGLGTLTGPLFAGALVERFGFRVPFLAIAAVAALITVALAAATSSHAPALGASQKASLWRAVRTSPLLAGALAIMFVGPTAETVLNVLAPIRLDENGESAFLIGAALAAASAVFVLVGIVVTRTATSAVRLTVAAATLALLTAPFLALLLTETTPAVVGALIVRMGLLGVLYTIAFPLGVLGAERAGIGSGAVAGLLMFSSGLANVAAPFIGGALAQARGDQAAYALVALTCLTCAAWLGTQARRSPRARNVPVTP